MVGSGDGVGQLPVPGRPTTLVYGRAGACCAYSRCGIGGLCFFFKCRLSYLPFSNAGNIVVSAVLTQQ